MKMTIHREGPALIAITLGVVAAIALAAYFLLKDSNWFWVFYALTFLGAVLIGLVVNFFRNPLFQPNVATDTVLAPANGKVVVIEEVEEPVYFKCRMLQISIFMSPLDVHVNRSPVSGIVKWVRYFPGKYLVAWHPKSSTENEQTFIVVENPVNGEVGFKQIAGALARRIRYYVKEGDSVDQGAEFGFIRFGSRVDVLLPLSAKPAVSLNTVVKGGRTVIARFG